jgi:hypothetical protein
MTLRYSPDKDKMKDRVDIDIDAEVSMIERCLDAKIGAGEFSGGSTAQERCVCVTIERRYTSNSEVGEKVRKILEKKYLKAGWKRLSMTCCGNNNSLYIWLFIDNENWGPKKSFLSFLGF